ncbi:MAG TPA: alpha/beta hydrolase [Acidimicrobiales bacterium]|nr:alpha/beta hydrolase [Acidimicrobiales bacterium]
MREGAAGAGEAAERGAPGALHVVEHPGTPPSPDPTVVLVHGSLDRGASFARTVRRLPDLHVVTYDRRGYHHSRGAGVARSLEEHVADLVALVGPGPAVVVGHSYGGDVALGAALAAPGAVRAVGAYEPPLPWCAWWPRRSASSIADEDPAAFAQGFFGRVVGEGGWERLSDQARAARRADGPALVAELADLRRSRPPFDVGALTRPLVLGRGGRSVWHHRRAVDALQELVPDAEVVEIPAAAHGAPLTHPDAFAALVRRVVARAAGG